MYLPAKEAWTNPLSEGQGETKGVMEKRKGQRKEISSRRKRMKKALNKVLFIGISYIIA